MVKEMSNISLQTIVPLTQLDVKGPLSTQTIEILATTQSVGLGSGALRVGGGVSVNGNLHSGPVTLYPGTGNQNVITTGTVAGNDTHSLLISAKGGQIELFGQDHSMLPGQTRISGSSVQIQTPNGRGIELGSDGNVTFTHDIVVSGSVVFADTTSTTTIAGDMTMSKNLDVGENLSVGQNLTVSLDALISGNGNIGGSLDIIGGLSVGSGAAMAELTLWGTADASDLQSGVLQVMGGASVVKNVVVGGRVVVENTVVGTSASTGALVVGGTLGAFGAHFGSGGVTVSANTPLTLVGSSTWTLGINQNSLVFGSGVFELNPTGITIGPTTMASIGGAGSLVVRGGMLVQSNAIVTGPLLVSNNDIGPLYQFSGHSVLSKGSIAAEGHVLTKALVVADIAVDDSVVQISGSKIECVQVDNLGNTLGNNGFAIQGSEVDIVAGPTSQMNISGSRILFSGTVDSSAVGSGAVQISGGLSVAKAVNVGGHVTVQELAIVSSEFSLAGTVVLSINEDDELIVHGQDLVIEAQRVDMSQGSLRVGGNVDVVSLLHLTSTQNSESRAIAFNAFYDSAWTQTDTGLGSSILELGSNFIHFKTGTDTTHLEIGNVFGVRVNSTCQFVNTVRIANTTDSLQIGQGSFVVDGGMSVAKQLFVGGSQTVSGNVGVQGSIQCAGSVTVNSTENSFAITNGALVVQGGVGIAKNMTVGENLLVNGESIFVSGIQVPSLVVQSTIPSTNVASGALVVNGGLGIGGSMSVGGSVSVGSGLLVSGQVTVNATTQSFDAASGCLVLSGGLGIARNVNIGGSMSVAGTSNVGSNMIVQGSTLSLGGNVLFQNDLGTMTLASGSAGLKITTESGSRGSQFANSISMFSLGGSFVDTNHEALQIVTMDTSGYRIASRASGSGTVRRMVLQAGLGNSDQIVLHTNGSVHFGVSQTMTSGSNVVNSSIHTDGDISIGGSGKLAFGGTNLGIPTTGVRSTGTRVVLMPGIGQGALEKAIGISETSVWFSNNAGSFDWHFGQSSAMSLSDTNQLTVHGDILVSKSLSITHGMGGVALGVGPEIAGNAIGMSFCRQGGNVVLPTLTDGDTWTIGRGILGLGQRAFGFGFHGPSGMKLALWSDNATRVYVPCTENSVDTSSGALIVAGGIGTGGNVNIAGNLNVSGTIFGTVSVSSGTFDATQDSVSPTTGTIVSFGGLGVVKSVNIGGSLTVGGPTILSDLSASGNVLFEGTVNMTGASVGVGGNLEIVGPVWARHGTIRLDSTGPVFHTGLDTVNGSLNIVAGQESSRVQVLGHEFRVGILSNNTDVGYNPENGNVDNGIGIHHVLQITRTETTIQNPVVFTSTHDSSGTQTGSIVISGGIGVAKTVSALGMVVAGTSDSTSMNSGSLAVAGGVGIAKSLVVGNRVVLGSALTSSSHQIVVNHNTGNTLELQNLAENGNVSTAFLNHSGNTVLELGVGNNVSFLNSHVSGGLQIGSRVGMLNTNDSNDLFSGSLVVSGGMAIAKRVNVGGNIAVMGQLSVLQASSVGGIATFANTVDSNSIGSGAVIVQGGMSVAKTVRLGSELNVAGGSYFANVDIGGHLLVQSTAQSVSLNSGSLVVAGGLGIAKNVNVGGNISAPNGTVSCQRASVTEIDESVSVSTGAFTVTGGAGIGRNVHVGGKVHVMATLDSTAGNVGALVVQGGIGIGKDVYCEGKITAVGPVTSVSDKRLKENIHPVQECVLEKICKLTPVKYNMIGKQETEIGFVAQQVQTLFPEIVVENGDTGMLSVDYARLTVVLVKALQELIQEKIKK